MARSKKSVLVVGDSRGYRCGRNTVGLITGRLVKAGYRVIGVDLAKGSPLGGQQITHEWMNEQDQLMGATHE